MNASGTGDWLIIDAHQHFWQLDRGHYAWLGDHRPIINHDFLPPQLAPHLQALGVSGTVLVQAAPSAAETEFLLELSAETHFIKGVVAWVDLASSGCAASIARLAHHPEALGVRAMLQPMADSQWFSGTALQAGLKALEHSTLVLDILMTPEHLNVVSQVLSNHPGLSAVINHAAKPNLGAPLEQSWKEGMIKLASQKQVFCKLSGMTATVDGVVAEQRLHESFHFLFETFGPERLIWGSDWPVLIETSSYQRWFDITNGWLSGLSALDRAAVLGGNACRVYGMKC